MLDSNCVLPVSFVVGRPDFVCSGLRCRKHKWDDNDDNFKLFAKPLLSPSPVYDINRHYGVRYSKACCGRAGEQWELFVESFKSSG